MKASTTLNDMRFAVVSETPITLVRRLGIEERGVDPMTGETIYRDHAVLIGKDGSVVCSNHGRECAFVIEHRTAEFVAEHGFTRAVEGPRFAPDTFGQRVISDYSIEPGDYDTSFERDEAFRLRDAIQLVEHYGMTVIREAKP